MSGFWWSSVVDAGLRAPGGGGGVVFPLCVKWCLLELSGVRTRPDLPQGRATAPCKQLAPVYVSRHFDVSSSLTFSSLTLKYFIHRIHVAWNGCSLSQAPLWVTQTFSSETLSESTKVCRVCRSFEGPRRCWTGSWWFSWDCTSLWWTLTITTVYLSLPVQDLNPLMLLLLLKQGFLVEPSVHHLSVY